MKRYMLVLVLASLGDVSFAQQPAQETPSATSDPATQLGKDVAPKLPCAPDNYLCILAQNLKKKDPATGSKKGISPGFLANQPPIPAGRLDLQFLRKNEING
jgi:hypothetical protein